MKYSSHSTQTVCEMCHGTLLKPVPNKPGRFRKRARFCSRSCVAKHMAQTPNAKRVQFKKGSAPSKPFPKGNQLHLLNTSGSKFTSENCSFDKHWNWKGDEAGYSGLHKWITRIRGKANHCEVCGCRKIPMGKKRWFDWANVSNEYKREVSDWKMMCKPCHRLYDGGHHVGNRHRKK